MTGASSISSRYSTEEYQDAPVVPSKSWQLSDPPSRGQTGEHVTFDSQPQYDAATIDTNRASPEAADGQESMAPLQKQRTKRLRFATVKRKGTVSKRFRAISQHIPGLSSIVESPEEEPETPMERTLYFNQPLPQDEIDPETGHPKAQFVRNKIRTTKYTPLTFVPLNLFYQFQNIANIYFLFIVILSAFPIFGVDNPGLAAVPIIVIVILTAIKDAIEDYRRQSLDSELNNTISHRLVGIDNPNVVEDQVSLWRRFKKANTRMFAAFIRVIVRACKRMVRKPIKESDYGQQVDLHTVVTASSYRDSFQLMPTDSASVYNRELTELPSSRGDLPAAYTVPSRERAAPPQSNDNTAVPAAAAAANRLNDKLEDSVIDHTREASNQAHFKRCFWKDINCGDIVKVYNDEEFPADMIVLSTSDPDGACYIETRNLDGETNLKVRQALKATSHIKHSHQLEQSMFQADCEGPHAGLYSFNGVLRWQQREDPSSMMSEYVQKSEPVSINNLLLRGCSLRNTKWVIGLAVYTGADTRVMLNSGETPAKRSRMMKELNINVIYNFVFVLILAFVAGLLEGLYWRKDDTSAHYFEFGSTAGSPAKDGVVTFWAAVILLQNLIPISLYISIEIIKTFQAFFIWSDTYMYYDKIDYPCTPKSWSISDDLGQVEYIFSDKTGTLTQNVMEFRKCTINGVSYGKAFTEAMVGMLKRQGEDVDRIGAHAMADIEKDRLHMLKTLREKYHNPQLEDDKVQLVSSGLVNDLVGGPDSKQEQTFATNEFMFALAVCHSVLPEKDEETNRLEFKAQSPDEEALVATARDFGYTLLNRTREGVLLDIFGRDVEVEVLTTLEFNSARKRMSVVIRHPDTGKLMLITKGADSVIYGRLNDSNPSLKEATAKHLEQFANEGLRTLCVAQKEITEEEYQEWSVRHTAAAEALVDRDEKLDAVSDEIEQDLTLIGGTAIEDRLQEGVPDAIALLREAGIKIWVLTGDKVETAINIGYSCNLLGRDMELLVLQLQEQTKEEAHRLLSEYLDKYFQMTGSEEELKAAAKEHAPPSSPYAVVVDGDALKMILGHNDAELTRKFVLLCKNCRSVLCCRVSPSQKALVVKSVKEALDVMTLAIGDGANDVAMILEADVGVGIAGLEGRQAVMSSDYAFGQFRFLTRLLLVHGRWAYRRLAEMTANLFYKNVVFTLTLFWYDVHNSFDGSYLFDYTYITLFNLAFTSLPVIFMGFLDQDVSDKVSMEVPQLYYRGIYRKEWTQLKFWIYMIDGIYQSAVCYFFSYGTFALGNFLNTNGLMIDQRQSYGVFTATAAIIACDLYVLINEYMWDWLFGLIVAISILLVFFWTGIYTAFTSSMFFYKAAPQVYSALPFWANTVLASVVCLLPRFASKALQKMEFPRDIDIIREQWNMGKFDHLKRPEEIEEEKARQRDNVLAEVTGEKDVESEPTSTEASASTEHSNWRQSLDRVVSRGGIRMSVELEDVSTAHNLMSVRSHH